MGNFLAFILLVCVVSISGCSTVRDFIVEKEGPELVAKGAVYYCELSEDERAANRAVFNDELAARLPGASVAFTCPGDAP